MTKATAEHPSHALLAKNFGESSRDDLANLFRKVDGFQGVTIRTGGTSALVEYENHQHATLAIQQLNEAVLSEHGLTGLTLEHAHLKSEVSVSETPAPAAAR